MLAHSKSHHLSDLRERPEGLFRTGREIFNDSREFARLAAPGRACLQDEVAVSPLVDRHLSAPRAGFRAVALGR